MGCVHAQVTLDHAEDPAQKHRLDLDAVTAAQHPTGQRLIVLGNVLSLHQTDRPVLHRLGHRWNRVLTHRGGRVDRQIYPDC